MNTPTAILHPRAARARFHLSFLAILIAAALPFARAQEQPKQPAAEQAAKGGGRGGATVAAGSQTFNTVIAKLKAGKQCFSNTLTEPDLEAAKKACEGQDFIWIEMQHSTLTWRETQQLIKVIAQAGC